MNDKISTLTSLLSAIVDNRGKSVPTSEFGFPLIATNCIKHSSIYPTFENIRFVDDETKGNWFRAHPKPNDIIFVNKGTPGRVCLVPDPVPFCFAQDMVGFRCDPSKIDYQYLFAVLRSDYIQEKIENYHVGLVIPHFKKGDLDNLLIPRMDTRGEELAIGELYLALSKKIEINNRINAELEAMAKTLYDYWFVQFDFPFDFAQGKPDANGKPYKTSGGKMLYNPILKREIPEGWEVKRLSDIANITMGQSPNGESYNEVSQGTIFFQGSTDFGWLFPTIRQFTTAPARMAKKGDILLSVRAPVGDMNIANNDCCIGRGLAALNSKAGYDGFLFYVMKYFKQVFDRRNSEGTIFGSITKDDLHSLELAYPDDALLRRYDGVVSNYNKMIFKRSLENQQLIELRDWLLPMLMNGQVTIKSATESA
jgi:type I restriction enzyme, S subunit